MNSSDTAPLLPVVDWNNGKDLVGFVDWFKAAQVLEGAIDKFNENFIRSKLLTESEVLERENVCWLLFKVSYIEGSYYMTYFSNLASVYDFWKRQKNTEEEEYLEKFLRNFRYQWHYFNRLYHPADIREGIDGYEISEQQFPMLSLRELSRLRYEIPMQPEFIEEGFKDIMLEINQKTRRGQELLRRRYLEMGDIDSRNYYILNEIGQPLLVTDEYSLRFAKINVVGDQLHCYFPNTRKYRAWRRRDRFYPGMILDTSGLTVHLVFDVYTNNLVLYEARRF